MSVIDEYLATVTPSQKIELERIRATIKQLVPDVQEAISYGMPVFKIHKQPLIWFGAFKNHMSLFPMQAPIELMADKLKTFKTAKGTIQFTEDHPIPDAVLEDIILYRLNSIAEK